MKGLLLAAGKGSRLRRNLGEDNQACKPLVRVCGKPLIEFSLNLFAEAGIDEITVVVDGGNEISNYLSGRPGNLSVRYAVQHEPLGIVNAVVCAADTFDSEDVMLQLSDEIFINARINEFMKFYRESGIDFAVSYTESSDTDGIKGNFSVISDDSEFVLEVEEKPSVVRNNKKGTGICIFSGKCLEYLTRIYDSGTNMPKELCDYINMLIKEGFSGKCFCIAEEEINVNTSDDLNYAKEVYETVKDIK